MELSQFIRLLDQGEISEITIRPHWKKYIFSMFLSLVFVGIGFLMIFSKHSSLETVEILFFSISVRSMGWIDLFFFGSIFCIFLFSLSSHRNLGLTLNSQGFYTTTLFKVSRSFSWLEIDFFVPGKLGRLKTVFFSYVPSHPEKGKWLTRLTQTMTLDRSSGITADACLPDTYGLKPEALCDLLNRCLILSREKDKR